ncbi:N-acetylglucosamine-6-phosphate deacetylase [uncultured Clostridium sp.]|uniref:N-acetylglucosamine-6-phosphate deacetylase n=1 Tax=uncultured Clostridium sp. TaxID=59620 RepID=UPI00259A3875|nr:N-acetylglucosamine-6-phosphate deacetylase [uncultured Clostridium sp.]
MLIQSKKVWIADQFIPAQIEIDDNKIVNIYSYNEKKDFYDYGSKRILPGFIDIHCHGAYGFDTNDSNEQGLRNWTKNIASEGVTSILPTTITQSKEVLTNALVNVAKVVEEGYEGAEILGIHFEGPYLDMEYKGAQPENHIVKPSIKEFQAYQKASKGLIKYVTLATEIDEDYELTEYLFSNDIVVSIGHSAATYEEAVLAFAHGARSQTHVYNGMTPFNHRKNGLVGAALRIKGMYGEVICDGNHSTATALYNFFSAKGPDYGIMVTDSLMAKGYKPGSKFIFGGNEIEIYEDGSAHLVETKGLAGSTLKMNEGLRILVEEAMVPFNYAINSCTINPAKCLGVDKRKGRIGVGYDSDIVVLNDDYSVHQTYCLGKVML